MGDASDYDMGAVISHTYPDDSEQPIVYVSRMFTKSEKSYTQLNRIPVPWGLEFVSFISIFVISSLSFTPTTEH